VSAVPGAAAETKSTPAGKAKRKRRTQAERRAATRAALLDATIECLVEDGYAGTTTTRVVERAGVSRGAQVHHFPTKAELVSEAVLHLARRRAAEAQEEIGKISAADPAKLGAALDLIWSLHNGPLYAASVELFVAARTDPELRARLAEVERDVTNQVYASAGESFADGGNPKALRECLDLTLAAMRGLALLEFADTGSGKRRWPRTKRRLLAMFAAALAE
jgi:AcrR family transcriptional regulator